MRVFLRCTLRDRRKARGLSIRDLEDISGIGRGHLSAFENDHTVMSMKTAALLALILDCKIDDFYEYELVADDV